MNATEQGIVDKEHLRLLSIFYYVMAATTALISCIFFVHIFMGIFFIVASKSAACTGPNAPPAFLGWLFVVLGVLFVSLGWTIAVLKYLVGRYLVQRKHHVFCLVMAGLSCLAIPYGTILGVFTFLVLLRPSVKSLFQEETLTPPNLPSRS